MIRDEFEKLFPPNESDAERQDALWLGFQAGHAAGLEDACAKLAELGQGGLVQTIRAMKEQRRGNSLDR